jgi:sporulation protein YlmC with PRC-barrel domain
MRNENFEIGADVFCEGTTCGRLAAVAVKPANARLAHLIVEPGHGREPRLVPAARAHADQDGISLDCTQRQFEGLEPAVIAHLEPADAATSFDEERRRRRHDEISSWPVFGLGPTVLNPSIGTPAPISGPRPRVEFEDRVPADEVRIHENIGIHAADGDIGRVAGVTVDPGDRRVTQILVDEGHLWGYKRVAIPMGAVRGVDDEGIAVRLSKRQIKDLPPVGDLV